MIFTEIEEIDSDQNFDGWYCIKTNKHMCPSCGVPVYFATAMHMILVWPEMDDPAILTLAKACKAVGRNPKIIEYEVEFGPALSYYKFEAMGRFAHM